MTILRGCDISRFQTVSSWSTLAKGSAFVVVKATEHGRQSPTWLGYSAAAKSAGMLRGSYHFGHPTNNPESEALTYVTALRAAGFRSRFDLPPVLDIEDAGGKTRSQLTTWCLVFLTEVDRMLKLSDGWLRTGVYTGRSFAADHLDLGRVIAGRWLWSAYWPNRDGSWPRTDGTPWPENAAIWQWTDRADVPGITRPCDGDVARLADLQRLAPGHYEGTDMTTDASVRKIVREEIAATIPAMLRSEFHRFLTGTDPGLENLDNPGSFYSLAKILQNIENDQDKERAGVRATLANIQTEIAKLSKP